MRWFLLLMSSFHIFVSVQQCRTTYSVWGRHLKGHLTSAYNVKDNGHCLILCSEDQRCRSTKFQFRNLVCELNDADRHTHPLDYKFKDGCAYSDYLAKDGSILKEYLMSPVLLEAYASYIDSYHSISNDQLTFNVGALDHLALLKVPLVHAGVVQDETPLMVEITVADDVTIGQSVDSDISYGLSDGSNFIGFTTYDKTNYNMFSPCVGMEATSGLSQSAMKTFAANYPIPNDKFYPEQFNFTLKVDKPCRSFCLTAHDGGFNKTVKYSKRRMVSQGLTLEVYKSEKGERVHQDHYYEN